jgi:putative thioredoxin
MAASPYIFETGAADFQHKVVARSASVPVLVDFWAAWCGPCKSLEPVLEQVAESLSGSLMIAKVDTDAEPELAAQFGVRSLPTLLLFRDGTPRAQTMGAQPQAEIMEFVRPYIRTAADELSEKADDAVNRGDMAQARQLLEQAVAEDPQRPGARYALAECMLAVGDPDAAEAAIEPLSAVEKESDAAHSIRDRIRYTRDLAGAPGREELEEKVASEPGDLEARYLLAAGLLMDGQLPEAMEQFFELMRRDRSFRDDAGRNGLLTIFNMLGAESALVADYRRRMASLLY